MSTQIIEILLCTAFGSFMFELAGITSGIWQFFKVKRKSNEWHLYYIPLKLTTCGKCGAFHTTWIYFHYLRHYFDATNQDWIISFACACVSGIISIYLINYAQSTTIR